jgi:drug/metabolite transporter (DMT)-like permease
MAAAMQEYRSHARAFAMLGLVMLFWAGNSIVGRAVRFDIPPFTLAFLRWAGALLVVAPFAIGAVMRDRAEILRGWKWILILGLLGVGAFNALLYNGLRYTTATNALLLQAAIPTAVVILDRLFFGRRANGWQLLGVAFSTVGVVAIVFEGDPASALRLHFGPGDILVLASVAVWAAYTVCLRLRPAISPVSFIAATFAIGVLAMAPFAAAEWHAGERIVWNARSVGALAYVALLPSLASYFIYNWAAGQVGAARAGQAITMMPLFGALLSAALLGEALHDYHIAGMALILAGIAIGLLALRQQVSAGAPQSASLEG